MFCKVRFPVKTVNRVQGGSKGSIPFYVYGHCDHIFHSMIFIF